MSNAAPFSADAAHICLVAAVRDVLTRLRPDVAARWLDCSADTVERMLAGSDAEGRWTTARTCRLVACERATLGTNRLADAMVSIFGDLLPPAPRSLSGEIRVGLSAICDLARDEALAVADGLISPAEAAKLAASIPPAIDHLTRLAAACAARRSA
jgi:hypothetical protein